MADTMSINSSTIISPIVQIAEIQIPVPWGHIAAKAWGDPCSSPVLCVHGIQDNAGTFDRLIPLLPSTFYFVCIDLPGHGMSSHYPMGITLDFLDYVTAIKRLVNFYKWEKFIFIGHSLGGQIGSYFAAIHPRYVTKLVMLDTISTFCISTEQLLESHRKLTARLFALEKRMTEMNAPRYSYEEALDRMVRNRVSKLTEEGATTLIKRSIIEQETGYYSYSSDQRLKLRLWPSLDFKQHFGVLKEIKCPQLIILAKESTPMLQMKVFKDALALFKRRSNFRHVVVEGNHDVHNNQPERVAPYINKFLGIQRSSL